MHVLLVEDDALFVSAVRAFAAGWRAPATGATAHLHVCSTIASAQAILAAGRVDVVLLDIQLQAESDGLVAVASLCQAAKGAPVVMHSVRSDHHSIVQAMRRGAHDYLPKHLGLEATFCALSDIVRQTRPQRPPAVAAGRTEQSDAMALLRAEVAAAKGSFGNVLVQGEAGSGKERIARSLAVAGQPFVAVDVSTLDESLASGLLMGSVRGAFTGADKDRPGLIEQAHGGVLFLDEVANLSAAVQAKLLRVLQEREVMRLGSSVRRPVRFRLVAATHVDLAAACRAGAFRYDLYTRLQVFVLQVPPLRQRSADIVALFAAFVDSIRGASLAPVSSALVAALLERPWHGNVRELEHAAQVACARAGLGPLLPAHLPAPLAPPPGAPPALDAPRAANADVEQRPLAESLKAFERQALEASYRAEAGNISRMARQLGMDRSRLHVKLRHYGIHTVRSH